MLTTQFAINISGPYFNAYMLEQLDLDYHHYMILIGTSFVTRILAGGWFQRLADKLGSTTLTHLGALLVIPSPTLWLWSDAFPYLVLAQVYTGIAWGCHELGMTLMLIDKQDHIERARLLTITTLLNSSMMCLGSLIGFYFLKAQTLAPGDYHFIFVLSACLRLIPFALLFWIGDSSLSQRGADLVRKKPEPLQ
jgi:MFS family permease